MHIFVIQYLCFNHQDLVPKETEFTPNELHRTRVAPSGNTLSVHRLYSKLLILSAQQQGLSLGYCLKTNDSQIIL